MACGRKTERERERDILLQYNIQKFIYTSIVGPLEILKQPQCYNKLKLGEQKTNKNFISMMVIY